MLWMIKEIEAAIGRREKKQQRVFQQEFGRIGKMEEISWDRNPDNYGQRKGTVILVSFTRWLTPTRDLIALKKFRLGTKCRIMTKI